MLELLDAITEKLTAAKTIQQLDQYLHDFLLKDCGCQNFVYTGYAKDFRTSHQLTHQLYSAGLTDWHHYYIAQGFEHIDPMGAILRGRNKPFIWRNAQLVKEVATHQKVIYQESIDLGFYEGINVPLHGEHNSFAILLIQQNNIDDFLAAHPGFIYILHLVGLYYCDCLTQLMKKNLEQSLVESLTARELECLSVSAEGLTVQEVAKKLCITPRTVSFHLENARHKLGMRNKAQTILKAKELGLIS